MAGKNSGYRTGSGVAEVLAVAGVPRMAQLLNICSSKSGRKILAQMSGMNESLLCKWSTLTDRQPRGGASRYVELLSLSAVAEIKSEQLRNSENQLWKTADVSADSK